MKKINIFIDMINSKVTLSIPTIFKYIKHRSSFNKFKKQILEGSPSFDLLWEMSNFIKLSEELYFYDNSIKNKKYGIFSSRSYINGENGFRINNDDVSIIVKLYADTGKVLLEVNRAKGHQIKTSFSFVNEKWNEPPTIYDEMILEQVIRNINSNILELFLFYYENNKVKIV